LWWCFCCCFFFNMTKYIICLLIWNTQCFFTSKKILAKINDCTDATFFT
jgi:hypothetical protein